MELKELAEWMKQRDIANSMKSYIHNAWVNGENYSAVEDLVTEGKANVTISLVQGTIRISKAETFEGDFESAKVELVEAKKIVKAQEKTIKNLEKELEGFKKDKEEAIEVVDESTGTINIRGFEMPKTTMGPAEAAIRRDADKLKPKKVKK